MAMKYSFDVFDTLLTRIVSQPVDVFRLVQDDLGGQEGIPSVLQKKFVSARVWAEFKSRRLSAAEDVSLAAIYKVIECDYQLQPLLAQKLLTKELEMEERCIVPIESLARKVRRLHDEGHDVIYISDMYLPADFIRKQLQRYEIFVPGDRLYVSGDLGVTKGSGNLYRHILLNEGLLPGQLIHCGDNHHSDAIAPDSLGIQLDAETRGGGISGTGLCPLFFAKVRYGVSLLLARLDLGVPRVV